MLAGGVQVGPVIELDGVVDALQTTDVRWVLYFGGWRHARLQRYAATNVGRRRAVPSLIRAEGVRGKFELAECMVRRVNAREKFRMKKVCVNVSGLGELGENSAFREGQLLSRITGFWGGKLEESDGIRWVPV